MKKFIILFSAGVIALASGLMLTTNKNTNPTYQPRQVADNYAADWHGAMDIHKYLHGDNYTAADVYKAYDNTQKQLAKRGSSFNTQWASMGPENIGGRTRIILVDPEDSDRLYAGGVSGGLFLSENGGMTWRPIDDLAPNGIISTGDIASDGTIYIGTGNSFDGFACSITVPWPGMGIYKSTDKGKTFTLIPSTMPTDQVGNIDSNRVDVAWSAVNSLKVDPRNPNVIYAALHRGFVVSKDGGNTWNSPLFIDCDNAISFNGTGFDIEFSSDNSRMYVMTSSGLFYSDDPANSNCYQRVPSTTPNLPNGIRVEISTAPSNPNVIYAIATDCSDIDVFRSNDKGLTWNPVNPAPPKNDINWEFCGGNGQCLYDLALRVYPDNEDHFLIGGVQFWRFDGNWTRAASGGIFPFGPNGQFYVHVDLHNFIWDPTDNNKVYILTDGGITVSNDQATTFNTINRDYVTTQFYDVHFSKEGAVVGGTQDNGVLMMNTGELGSPKTADRVVNQGIVNGDGFDCEVSQIVDVKFTTAQFGNLGRSLINSNSGAGICEGLCNNAPFWTVIKLWESNKDISSKDSIVFAADTFNQAIGVGSGSARTYRGTLTPLQESADIVYSTLTFSAGSAVILDSTGNGVWRSPFGTATVNQTDGTFEVTFNNPPNLNSPIFANYGVSYSAGAEVEVPSVTDRIPIKHTLTNGLQLGETTKIQDPVQSLLAMFAGGGVQILRGAINVNAPLRWLNVSQGLQPTEQGATMANGGAFAFTSDGNHLFVGSNRNVFRISNLNQLYQESDRVKLTSRVIYNTGGTGGNITDIAIHPDDPEKILITVGGYNTDGNKVVLVENALSSMNQSATQSKIVMGEGGPNPLPVLPVYTGIFDQFNPSTVLVGTLYGVWSTRDIFANPVRWANESATLGRWPVYQLRQQTLPWNQAVNSGVVYAASFGRGIWRTDNFVSVPEFDAYDWGKEFQSSLKLYPNPMQNIGTIELNLPSDMVVEISIFNINGQLMRANRLQMNKGENIHSFDVSELSRGTYFAVISAGEYNTTAKFVKY